MFASVDDSFHHVRDTYIWELPQFVLNFFGRTSHFQTFLTKYMVLQLVAALLVYLIFHGLAKRVAGGKTVKGGWWNFWESIALFVRDEVVRPSIGIPHHLEHGHDDHAHHDHDHSQPPVPVHAASAVEVGHPADAYLPYVWSVFFYILFCNLLGAVPFLGSPTANINVTGVLALVTMVHVVIFGSQVSGFGDFLKHLAPTIDLPGPAGAALKGMIWGIEAAGFLIKHIVLAIRLFANIMAGHTVLGVFLAFIALSSSSMLWGVVMPASVFAQVGIGLLELFVAFLQAYVFALLTSLFIGAAVNPH